MLNSDENKIFLVCEKCGKKMIERMANGIFKFVFGKKKDREGKLYEFCPVEMFIHGSLKMRCLSRECGHWNIFNYLPFIVKQSDANIRVQSGIEANKK